MAHILSSEDLTFFAEQGYVIVKNAVPAENLQAVIDAVWQFQEMDPDDPTTWYRKPERDNGMVELNGAGMVEMYHHPALWANRQVPRIYEAFVDIWGTEKLWVSIDRANLNVPNRPGFEFNGFMHWDIDTSVQPLPFAVQGILSLTNTAAGQGGFQCIPGMPKKFEEWVKTQPVDRDPYTPDLTGLDIETVETQAGDLLIWNSQLPHGVSANTSSQPRLAQYLSMAPAQEENNKARQWRIDSWLYRQAPQGNPFPGDPRDWERQHGTTAAMTPLGRKVLGLDTWDTVSDEHVNGDMALNQETGRTRSIPGFSS